MFNRILNHQSIINIDQLSIICIAYGNSYHIYHKYKQTCISQINIGHTSNIIFTYIHNSNIYSIDQDGIIIIFNLNHIHQQYQSFQPIINKKITIQHQIKNCKIYKNQQNQIIILFIDQQKQIHKYNIITNQSTTLLPTLKFQHIITYQQPYAIIKQSNNDISILNTNTNYIIKQYSHTYHITSATIHQNDLIIGDQKGKIYIFNQFLSQNKSNNKSKLQWHVGPVNCLQCVGHYLYSGGQQSVVVMWHLSQMSRDFLPRIGTSIKSLYVQPQSNQIVCGMADSSVKVIVMNNEKQVRTYKTVLDPFGYGKRQQQKIRFKNNNVHEYNGMLCLNSVAGRIQLINTNNNGINYQLQIVNRNLICGLDNQQPNPHQIQFTCFSPQWNYMLAYVQNNTTQYNHNVLKFYKKTIQYNIQLINQVYNPHHKNKVSGCKYLQYQNKQTFLTYSNKDNYVKIWAIIKRKKQSILQSQQIFWNCIMQYNFRSLSPTFVDTYKNICIISYKNQIIILKNMKQYKHYNVDKVQKSYILCQNVYLICLDNRIQLWNNNNITITFHNHNLKQLQKSNQYFGLLTNYKDSNKIIIINKHNYSLHNCYQFNNNNSINIQSIVFRNQQLIIIGNDFKFLTINIKQNKQSSFIKYKSQKYQQQRKQTITDIEQTYMQIQDIQLQELYQRHIKRHNNQNKPIHIINQLQTIPSTTVSAQMLMNHMFV